MVAKPTFKSEAWVYFDRIVADAAPSGVHSNPWVVGADGILTFEPDYVTLQRLLGVPLYLKATTTSGVPALALDVWLSYELRRAGFDRDQVWPRPVNPRVLPAPVAALLTALPVKLRHDLLSRIVKASSITGVTAASAKILGKNYLKQVDVIISDWVTGPELLISTKRMDSSYGKNAPNRVEESYGDAKNLRLRHPLAALGFVFGLRSDILQKEPATSAWLNDLLAKLGQEDDAYHATCLILMEYGDEAAVTDSELEPEEQGVPEPGGQQTDDVEDLPAEIPDDVTAQVIERLPKVKILVDQTPPELGPGRFLAAMAARVIAATPVNMHTDARKRRSSAVAR